MLPGVPHHITQRGNRRQPTFFCEADYRLYRDLMAEWGTHHGMAIWAYCLMPNHVHLIAVPERPESLAKGLGEAHQRYTRAVNKRQGWTGYLWQGRFHSSPLDEAWLYHAALYVELNPVRAGLVAQPGDYPWSSAAAHLANEDDALVKVAPLLQRWPDWADALAEGVSEAVLKPLRERTRTGRLLGSDEFVARAEASVGRRLRTQTAGRPRVE